MKCQVEKNVFLKALSHGQSVVEKRNTIPILSHVLIHAIKDQGLQLTTTDSDMVLEELIPCEVEEEGVTTVSAQMLFEMIRKIPDGTQIKLTFQENQLHLQANRTKMALSCLPPDGFPQMKQAPLSHFFKINAMELKKLIDKTRFAIAGEDVRFFLNGLFFHQTIHNGTNVLRVVATDGHRLAYAQLPLPEGAEGMPYAIISKKTIQELRKLLDENDSDIDVGLSENRIEFRLPGKLLSARLIEGTFPNYEDAIPSGHDRQVIVNVKELSQAVDRVGTPLLNEKVRVVRWLINQHLLTLSSISQNVGSAVEEIAVDYTHNDPLDIGFNPRYLLDVLQQISEDEAVIHLRDSHVATLIEAVNDKNALYVIMPMRV